MNGARNADHAERVRERFAYSIVKITRLYDYQTWRKHYLISSWGAQRFVGLFSWLCVSDADWLGRQTPITWMEFLTNKSHSRMRRILKLWCKRKLLDAWERGTKLKICGYASTSSRSCWVFLRLKINSDPRMIMINIKYSVKLKKIHKTFGRNAIKLLKPPRIWRLASQIWCYFGTQSSSKYIRHKP